MPGEKFVESPAKPVRSEHRTVLAQVALEEVIDRTRNMSRQLIDRLCASLEAFGRSRIHQKAPLVVQQCGDLVRADLHPLTRLRSEDRRSPVFLPGCRRPCLSFPLGPSAVKDCDVVVPEIT